MKRNALIGAMIVAATLAACKKHEKVEEAPVVAAPVPVTAPDPASAGKIPAAELTDEQREMAKKQALLAYGVMEDKYINDPRAQWATEAKASSVFGDQDGRTPSDSNLAKNAVGPSDGNTWTNNHIDQGFDWLEATFATPVNATEVRFVLPSGQGVEAVNKVELQDTDGKWNTVWEGVSDVKKDDRGNRTWFVRTFDKTPYKAKAVKITYANNLQHDYKVIDAVQLVGDK